MYTILHLLLKAVWAFWALGPQLALCLVLAWKISKRREESRLSWMIGGFFASLVPVLGLVPLLALWRAEEPAERRLSRLRGGRARRLRSRR